MRIAQFDPFSGVSGNMILGALLECGLSVEQLEKGLGQLSLSGWKLTSRKVSRNGLTGTYVEVSVPDEHVHRHLSDIRGMLEASGLPAEVKASSLEAFTLLAQSEALAHGTDMEKVHFHEVGAMDAVIDVVGSFLGLHLLGIEKVHSSAVALGTGTVKCAHGVIPVPSPATLRLLRNAPVRPTSIAHELATPTGAAVLAAAVDSWGPAPGFKVVRSGMGAGSRDNPEMANLLRLTIGETEGHQSRSALLKLETLIDDMDPRIWPELNSGLLNAGAVDCYARHCMGKKGRTALELVVLVPSREKDRILEVLFAHSSTLGARVSKVERVVLDREFRKVRISVGSLSVKLGFHDGRPVSAEPEFDDCAALAEVSGVPLKLVVQEAKGAALALLRELK